jgi:TPR repeat protein
VVGVEAVPVRLILALAFMASVALNLLTLHILRDLSGIAADQDKALTLYRKAAIDGVELAERMAAAYDRCRGLRVVAAP